MNEFMDKISASQIASKPMMNNSILPLCTMLACTVSVLGCIGPEGDVESESVATTQEAAFTSNAFTSNAFTSNAFTSNAFTSNAFTSNAFTSNALLANQFTADALHDPLSREALKYITSCALPESAHIQFSVDGVNYNYKGQLALAPEWGVSGGSCNQSCQEWVSACLMARLDYLGEQVTISLRGDKPTLVPSPVELKFFTYREASYFGNVFVDPQVRDACVSPGRSGIPRVCGPTLDDCAVDVIGDCGSVCDAPAADGGYRNCRDHARVNGVFPPGTKTSSAVLTVFLLNH
jgi:hypothetical protein